LWSMYQNAIFIGEVTVRTSANEARFSKLVLLIELFYNGSVGRFESCS